MPLQQGQYDPQLEGALARPILGGDGHEPLDSLGSYTVDEVPRALRVEVGRRLGITDPATVDLGLNPCELWVDCLGIEDAHGLRTEVGRFDPQGGKASDRHSASLHQVQSASKDAFRVLVASDGELDPAMSFVPDSALAVRFGLSPRPCARNRSQSWLPAPTGRRSLRYLQFYAHT